VLVAVLDPGLDDGLVRAPALGPGIDAADVRVVGFDQAQELAALPVADGLEELVPEVVGRLLGDPKRVQAGHARSLLAGEEEVGGAEPRLEGGLVPWRRVPAVRLAWYPQL
jgi:hypothetical protein